VSEVATVAGGCFWCLEAVFERLDGVSRVRSGYTGGNVENPSYHDVCNGTTGHAEALQVTFDPAVISYEDLLEIFFAFHDPTTLNRQGPDQGTQYRSAIFYHDTAQKAGALRVMERLTNDGLFERPIVTELAPAGRFFPAETYHQEYYRRNPSQAYCQAWIAPKVAKLRSKYAERLKASL
jgi:peptide-methionine (S)-S-oxide reductase